MRFAFKTAPQNTTWPEVLAVWKEADDIEISSRAGRSTTSIRSSPTRRARAWKDG